MNIKELKELINDLPDDYEVFIDGDHQGTSNCVGYHVGHVAGEDQYEMYAVELEDVTDDPDTDPWDDDKHYRGDLTLGVVLYGVA